MESKSCSLAILIAILSLGGCSYLKTEPKVEPVRKEKIINMINKSTVVISLGGKVVGSGVIIEYDKKQKFISVLTARHVVGIKPGWIDVGDEKKRREDPYTIADSKGAVITNIGPQSYDERVKFPENNTDLVVLKIPLGKWRYAIAEATLAKDITVHTPSHIFTYLPCAFSPGKTPKNQLISGDFVDNNLRREWWWTSLTGYDVKYTNNTVPGMSGSPVLDAAGRVVAIHAKTEQDEKYYDGDSCKKIPQLPDSRLGYNNLGLSISRHLNFLLSAKSSSSLVVSNSSVNIDAEPKVINPTVSDNDTFFDNE